MATNLAIDEKLLFEAQKIGHHTTKKETVNVALTEYIRHHRQQKVLDLFGTVEFAERYDYKAARGKR